MYRNAFTPQFQNLPYTVQINENFGPTQTQSIFQVTATDADPTNTFEEVRYRVTGDGNAAAFFSVNEFSGRIFITQSVANIAQVTYTLRITAYDNGLPQLSNSTTVTITVDRNQNAPFFQQTSYSADIADNGVLGAEVVQVYASDQDTVAPYNTVRYILRSTSGSEYFFINVETGMIYVARSVALDTNAPTQYILTVGVYDLGVPSRSGTQDANVFISVIRNQFSPVFFNDPYTKDVEQSLSVGSFVLQVTSSDADTVSPFGEVTMRLIGDDAGVAYFNFDPLTGDVTVAQRLTFDAATFYQLRIEARDGGSPARSATALAQITVLRNLFTPEFDQLFYNTTIDETLQPGQTVVQILASDSDATSPHNTITYTLNNNFNNLASQYFTVNPATGAVTLSQSLLNDNSDTTRFTFSISIRDNGVPSRAILNSASVEVNVIRNIQPPIFISTPYDTEMDYTDNIGTPIFTATARDGDISPYNIVTYDLIGDGDATVFFNIDAGSGVVTLQQIVQQETTTQFRVRTSYVS